MSADSDGDRLTVSVRRDRLVVVACLSLAVLQTLPYVVVGWISGGGTAAGDGALYALAPTSLLGLVAFGLVLAGALARRGLQPVPTTTGPPCVVPAPDVLGSPGLATRPAQVALRRLRWGAVAALADAGVQAAAVLLDDAGRSGAEALGRSLDDGSALWAYVVVVGHVLVTGPRAPLAVVVGIVVLTRASRPVGVPGFRAGCQPESQPGARTTRWCPDPPPR